MKSTRLDFCIEEAGCLLWVAPMSLGGRTPAELANIWMGEARESVADLIKAGAMMPMALYQDDGYLVRFVFDELTEQETSEWVATARWKLDVACGRVLVSGILTPDCEKEFAEIVPAEANGSYWAGAYVTVPPALYQVEVYSYAPGDLTGGWGMIVNSRTFGKHPGIEPERALDYFRRTRPDETAPAWLKQEEVEEDEGLYVDFIVRLAPLQEALPEPQLDGDGIAWQFRKPEKCPLGIRSTFVA